MLTVVGKLVTHEPGGPDPVFGSGRIQILPDPNIFVSGRIRILPDPEKTPDICPDPVHL